MERAICRKFCSFYRPGRKEDMKCGTFAFLSRNLTHAELLRAASQATTQISLSHDTDIREIACKSCEFLVDGCDFRDGAGKTPCGAYAVVEHLLRRTGQFDTEH